MCQQRTSRLIEMLHRRQLNLPTVPHDGETQSDRLNSERNQPKLVPKKRSAKLSAWNKGIALEHKDAFTPDQVKRIRQVLARRGGLGLGELALFSVVAGLSNCLS
jgi:hypothetical protein